MSKKDSYLNDTGKRERLALAGLAADRKTATEPCPDDERFAEFLEADPASPEQQRFVKHLAACESCRQKWLILSEELVETDGKMTKSGAWYGNRGLLSVFGSACALAAGVMLYLAIDYRPVTFNVADSPAPERVQEAPVDQKLNQGAVADSDVLPREKLRVEELAEADTAEPAAEVASDREESRVLMSVESAPKSASAPTESLGAQTSSKKAGSPAKEEGFSAKADALEFQDSPVDQELNQVAVADSDVLPREKSRDEKLKEADTAEPGPDVVSERKEFRKQMTAELSSKPASAPAKALGMQSSSKKAGPPDEEEVLSAKADGLEFQELLEAFFESFSSHCQSREAGDAQGVDLTNTAEQGRALLKFEETMEIPYQLLIREIVQLLAQKEPVKDTELDELCRQTGRVTAEMDKAGP